MTQPYTYPTNQLDKPEALLALVGTFWENVYQGSFPVQSYLYARGQLDAQLYLNTLDLLASVSRYTVPVFRKENWYFLELLESQRNLSDANLARYIGTHAYQPGDLEYGIPVAGSMFSWNVDPQLVDVPAITNRITDPSLTFLNGVDFLLEKNANNGKTSLTFRDDPFADPLTPIRTLLKDNKVIDRQAGLWIYRGELDLNTVYEQFGYALGVHLSSSEGYRELINAVFDGLIDGGSSLSLDRLFATVAGVDLAHGTEVVEDIVYEPNTTLVITDKFVYRFNPRSTIVPAVGDTIRKGDSLSDALTVFEFNRGQLPPDLRALAVGEGLLGSGYFQDLVFENKVVPLVVEEDVDGYTKVSFEVGGVPADAEAFWADVHRNGVASGQTLAMLLDQRPASARTSQPTAMALPATVNPLGFLTSNLFRNNLFVVKLRTASFGPGALGMSVATLARRLVPPGQCCVVLVELVFQDDPVTLDAPGDDLRPGFTESVKTFTGTAYQESLPYTLIRESVRVRYHSGQCL